MRSDVLRQILPVFLAEAREHVAAIGTVVMEIERNPGNLEAVDAVRRTAHALKGSAASLGLGDLEALSHAIEDVFARFDPVRGVGRSAVQAVLDALQAMDEALVEADAGGELRVGRRDALLAALQGGLGAAAGTREAVAVEALERAVERLCTPLEAVERNRIAAEAGAIAGSFVGALSGPPAALAARISAAFGALASADETDAARGAARLAGDLLALKDALGAQPAVDSQAAGEAQAAPAPRGEPEDRAVRVLASTLDSLARRLELLALTETRHGRRAREIADAERDLREAIAAIQVASRGLLAAGVDAGRAELEIATARLHAMAGELRRLSREGQRDAEQQRLTGAILREDLRSLRMVPAALAIEPARRAVREAALRLGKEVEVQLEGGEVRLDRRLVDDLRAPMLHLVRNAVDHGIEPAEVRRAAGKPAAGRISIRVEPRGSRVAVLVEDDGGGLDLGAIRRAAVRRGVIGAEAAASLPDAEAARLAFSPGLSTARAVTTVSGRGVGLDAVAVAMIRMRGAVEVKSTPGRGTRFELDLPLTLAATAGVLLRVGSLSAIIPADAVERVLLLEDVGAARERGRVRVGEVELPFAGLAEVLGLALPASRGRAIGLVLAIGSQRAVLGVDEVLGEQEVVVSALGGHALRVAHLAGAALLDDGGVIGVLAPAEILRRIRPSPVAQPVVAPGGRSAIVADDTVASRTLMAALLEADGFAVRLAPDGAAALALLREAPCDVLVSDVQMPVLDGLELVRRVRAEEQWRALPIVLVSTLDAPDDVRAGVEAGASAYLSKRDLQGDALPLLVRRLLEAGSAR
jgi:two-component system chemotaxis sensor kinase CheA